MRQRSIASIILVVTVAANIQTIRAFSPPQHQHHQQRQASRQLRQHTATSTTTPSRRISVLCKQSSEWQGDFDEYVGDSAVNDGSSTISFTDQDAKELQIAPDLSGCQARQFSLGQDIVIDDFLGNMGFEEVTDWEYYYESEDDNDDDRQVVRPNPLDPAQPKRTRESSGSVVRIFRAQFVGRLGATLRAKGLDKRVLIKEFTGKMALDLSRAELISIGTLQSTLVSQIINDEEEQGEWRLAANSRSVMSVQDDEHLCRLAKELQTAPYTGIYGEINLQELEDDGWDPNEFYRTLKVKPPKPGAIWIVYEYAGLTSLEAYCVPGEVRRQSVPPKRGIFGNLMLPPDLPPFDQRAAYVRAIMSKSLSAVAQLHDDGGISHRSIGRSSLIMSTTAQDKREASSVYTTNPTSLVMKLSDLGFSGTMDLATYDEDFCRRARTYGIAIKEGSEPVKEFCQAEDLHALGLVFLALLLTTLADAKGPQTNIPATDEDTLQRLTTDIFDKDIHKFREYMEAEPDIWDYVLKMLDERQGWELLDQLLFAREKVKDGEFMPASRILQESTFFS